MVSLHPGRQANDAGQVGRNADRDSCGKAGPYDPLRASTPIGLVHFSSSIGSLPTRPLVGPKGTGHRTSALSETTRPRSRTRLGPGSAQEPGRPGTEAAAIAGTVAAGPAGPAKLWS